MYISYIYYYRYILYKLYIYNVCNELMSGVDDVCIWDAIYD